MLITAIHRLVDLCLGPNPEFALIEKNARLPTHGSDEAAGLDLYSPVRRVLEPGIPTMIPLGIASQFRKNWVGQVWDRSSMGRVGNHRLAGVVDSDYRGEWKVILINLRSETYEIAKGDRIAQVVFVPCWTGGCRQVASIGDTARGSGGYGSTGK